MLMQSVFLRTPRGDRKPTDPEAGRRSCGGRDDWSVVPASALWSLRQLWAARGRSCAGGRWRKHSCFLDYVALLVFVLFLLLLLSWDRPDITVMVDWGIKHQITYLLLSWDRPDITVMVDWGIKHQITYLLLSWDRPDITVMVDWGIKHQITYFCHEIALI